MSDVRLPSARGARLISLAGWTVIVLSAGAALLPATGQVKAALIVGAMMMGAGIVELVAGAVRRETRPMAMLAGALTLAAGLWFWFKPGREFLPTVYVVTVWLLARGVILAIAGFRTGPGVRRWTWISAATDVALSLLLIAGLTSATLVVSLFGPTPEIVASFAWVLAASFVTTGLMLLEVASCAWDDIETREASERR
ncbi:hypothetical protein HMF7854_10590 [Sphingomonas ginkgonis]|uniref:HdeD family acid-resistance protein n=1 Tax=Sphingomonas ginkgonis TaxID=2315330 RepID=A0A429VBP7_9SPHN|nr:DUF308 domain-containing protein [Sphingomonas ginkgonis]RST31232.1 hypothetical protein HMF7854_10590 [Sphingomonas ginkgonis]